MALALAPVDAELLREERGDHEADPVRHEALARELAHPGIDEREAGAARLPRLERVGVVVPGEGAAVALLVLVVEVVGMVEEDLVEEVAPSQVAALVGRAPLHLE